MNKNLKRLISAFLVIGMLFSGTSASYADQGKAVIAEAQYADTTKYLGANSYTVYKIATYSSLTTRQKKIYDFVKSILNSNAGGTKTYRISATVNDWRAACRALNDTYFQYYSMVPLECWCNNPYSSTGVQTLTLKLDCKVARGRMRRSAENKRRVAEKTKSVIKGASSTRVKYFRILNYTCRKLTYSLQSPGTLDTSIRGSLAKCSGYSSLVQAMCIAAGIPCVQVTGLANSYDSSSGHAWNRVKIGSVWYYSDPTWYDSTGCTNSSYALSKTLWSGRTKWAELYTINFRSRGYAVGLFD